MSKPFTVFLLSCLALAIPGCGDKQQKIAQNSRRRSVSKTDLSAFEARHADIYLPVVTDILVLDFEKKVLVIQVPRSLDLLIDDYMRQMELLGWRISTKSHDGIAFMIFSKPSKTVYIHARSVAINTTELSLAIFSTNKTL